MEKAGQLSRKRRMKQATPATTLGLIPDSVKWIELSAFVVFDIASQETLRRQARGWQRQDLGVAEINFNVKPFLE